MYELAKKLLVVATLATCLTPVRATEGVVTNAVELKRLVLESREEGRPFEITCTALKPRRDKSEQVLVRAGENAFTIFPLETGSTTFSAGDLLRIKGVVRTKYDGDFGPIADSVERLAPGPKPEPVPCQPEDIYSGRRLYDLVRVRGTVIDAFRDETNPDYCFIVLAYGADTLYCSSFNLGDTDLSSLVDAHVAIDGLCFRHTTRSPRNPLRYEIAIERADDITVLNASPDDPFNVPILDSDVYEICHPAPDSPRRKRLVGTVAAVWRKNRVLLRKADGTCSLVDLLENNPPPVGETIEAAGLPETDFYHLNLSRAIWRKTGATPVDDPPPEEVTVDRILADAAGRPKYDITYHSRVIRVTGTVSNLPTRDDADVMHLTCGEYLVPVAVGNAREAIDDLLLDSTVEITGVCIMETENWRPQEPFPHVKGMSVVLRRASDLRILSKPNWWTIGKSLAVIGSLLAVIAVILIWNAVLRRLVTRKGHELVREQIRNERARLKAEERTRLAVELHDTISQNLTGISMQIDAATNLIDRNVEKSLRHLAVASRTLDSCRSELRNCIWDLRHGALDAVDMDDAIRGALASRIGDTNLIMRFSVSRARFSDNFAHALIQIVRELATNAVLHGRARNLRVAGALENERLLVSVVDDGTGFDPANCPGIDKGHFGLQGIRERLKSLNGTITIDSAPGRGTRAVFSLALETEKRHE